MILTHKRTHYDNSHCISTHKPYKRKALQLNLSAYLREQNAGVLKTVHQTFSSSLV